MTTYNTGNPVPSADARDRYDNSQVFDEYVTGSAESALDRLGVQRRTWRGLENAFDEFLTGTAFELPPLVYVDGTPLQVDRATQLIQRGGLLYSVKLPSSFPVTLSGTWTTDEPLLTVRNDQSLRQQLADSADPLKGAALVGRNALIINHVTELRATPGRFNGDRAMLLNYNAGDKKGRGRYLTWVPGSPASDDGGMRFAATGGVWFSDLNEDGRVCSEFYGLPLAAGQFCLAQDAAIEAYCFANKVSAWYGPGPDQSLFPAVYDFGAANWNWSGPRVAGQPLKDYQGVRIYSQRGVTFQTTSVNGADVMQCSGIKNFGVLGFPKVTATISGSASGSNGVSLVFGAVDCIFELDCRDLPAIYKADGSVVGGSAFSIQPGVGNTNLFSNVILRGNAVNCSHGFTCPFFLDDHVLRPIDGVVLDIYAEDCYRGLAIAGAAPTVAHSSKAYTGITGNMRLKNCQQSVVNFRTVGTRFNVDVANTKDIAALVKHPFNTAVVVTNVLAAKDGYLRVQGRVLSVDTLLNIGGTAMGGIDTPTTESFELEHDVTFNSAATAVLSVVLSSNVALDKCKVSLWNITTGYDNILALGSNDLFINGCACGHAVFPGDTAVTTKRVAVYEAHYTAPITANRAVTAFSAPIIGDKIRVFRHSTATGASAVVFSAISTNLTAGQFAEATWSGTAWLTTKAATAI